MLAQNAPKPGEIGFTATNPPTVVCALHQDGMLTGDLPGCIKLLAEQLTTAKAQTQYWQARAEFYRTQWLNVAGQLADEHAQPGFLKGITCGPDLDMKPDQNGVPVCEPKPSGKAVEKQ